LRKGYKSKEPSLFGIVAQVVTTNGLQSFFDIVNYKEVIPTADSKESAVNVASDILGIPVESDTRVLGLMVELCEQSFGDNEDI
jgi:hypothetical protein